jgi:hypothetical protein
MFCRTCGLSMSDAATFCPTCGTRVLADAAVAAEHLPEAPASAWAAGDDQPAPPAWSQGPAGYRPVPDYAAPAAPVAGAPAGPSKTVSLVNKHGLLLIVAALVGAVALLAVIVGIGLRHSVATSDSITLSDYSSIQTGMDLSAVDAYLGGTPTSQTPDASLVGGVDYRWENRDHSSVTVVVVNGRVAAKSESGLKPARLGVNRSFFAMLSLAGLLMSLVWFLCMTVCLYLATLVVDCSLTPVQVLAISAICAAITMFMPMGFLVALVVAFVLIMKWGGTEVVDTIIILVADFVLTLVAGYLVGGLIGAAFGFGFRL